nr:MAG TPA: hypothetical protein [Caudoviricetes sp.]
MFKRIVRYLGSILDLSKVIYPLKGRSFNLELSR